jgi:hypothetical protein
MKFKIGDYFVYQDDDHLIVGQINRIINYTYQYIIVYTNGFDVLDMFDFNSFMYNNSIKLNQKPTTKDIIHYLL